MCDTAPILAPYQKGLRGVLMSEVWGWQISGYPFPLCSPSFSTPPILFPLPGGLSSSLFLCLYLLSRSFSLLLHLLCRSGVTSLAF